MNLSFETKDLLLISPIVALFIASLIPILSKVIGKNNEPGQFFKIFVPLMGVVAALVLTVLMSGQIDNKEYIFSGALVVDGLSVWSNFAVLIILAATILITKESSLTKESLFSEYIFLLMNSAIGMILLAWSNDLIMVFISIEMLSLCYIC